VKLGPQSYQLIEDGPLVRVELRHHPAAEADMRRHVQLWGEVPSVPPVWFLVDTGARHTIVDQRILDALKLEPYRFTSLETATVVLPDCPTYLAELLMELGTGIAGLRTSVIGLPAGRLLGRQGGPKFQGILGRSALQKARFTYDGAAGTFEIAPAGKSTPP
jgi:hypothetical protein